MSQRCPLCGTALIDIRGHGPVEVCNACFRVSYRFLAHLESLSSPAALIARDHIVVSSNDSMRKMFDDNGRDPVGLRIGEVLDCKHAVSHGLCGETFACLQCGLRRLIALCGVTGERLAEIPTRLLQQSGDNATYSVSAERAGAAIILRVGMAKTRSLS